MSVTPNAVDGAVIAEDGALTPVAGSDASTDDTRPPKDRPAPTPIAMTNGRQMSAA